ncbi:MAG: peptidyl-prolyl cis-trans isomerase [Alphaproteobacteria bacterium]|nr:peptidyl-prolyl cis-trans isomerase [Alphaproteobacteria bacterium]
MISTFSKMHNSLFTKIILTITALSFMSLFGVSGYINSANSNKPVIKVDNLEISQSEFNYMLQKELSKLKDTDSANPEEAEARKAEISAELAKIKLDDLLLENTMKKFKVDVTDSLVSQIIQISPQFLNNGKFDREMYKWYMNKNNLTEKDLVAEIKRNIGRKILVETQVEGFKVPEVLQSQMQKVLGQRRTFKYIKLVAAEAKIDRKPSQEELNQYYEDFTEDFRVPEKRDVKVLSLPLETIEKSINVSDDEINTYYKEHIEEYEQPEKRHVLQLAFEDEESAKKAEAELAAKDFMAVAAENGQSAEDTDFGDVAKSDLSDELADVVFSLAKGQISKPENINGGWQILKVTDIIPASSTPRAQANEQIKKTIQEERAYDGSYELMTSIEDKLGAGVSLADIAKEYNIELVDVKNLAEDGSSDNKDKQLAEVLKNKDVIDAAFSYNAGEVSQTIEGDDGLIVVEVEKVHESHIQPENEVTAKITKLWQESEKVSITQELVDNINHDLEAGDTLSEVAGRYNLPVMKTMPITRGETFADLNFNDMKTLFSAGKEEAKVLQHGDDYLIAETNEVYDDSSALSQEDKNFLKQALQAEMAQEMADALLHGYAKDYKVEVNYGRMGIND